MGHLVNPISFRLGVTQSWKSNWFKLGNRSDYLKNLREDLSSYKYIENFFFYFKFLKKFDNVLYKQELERQTYLRPSQIKKFQLKQHIMVKFFNLISFIFSHINIGRFSSNLLYSIHIYDGALQYKNPVRFFLSRLTKFNKYTKYKYIIKNKLTNLRKRSFLSFKHFKFKNYREIKSNLYFLLKKYKNFKINLIHCILNKLINIKIKKRLFIKNQIKIFKFLYLLIHLNKLSKIKILFLIRLQLYLLNNIKKKLKFYLKKKKI